MVIKEGVGTVSPAAIPIALDRNEMLVMRDEAMRRYEYRSEYTQSRDLWKKGLMVYRELEWLGSMPPSAFPIFAGMCGEYALACYLNSFFPILSTAIDVALKDRGDSGKDLLPFGYPLQVKTRTSKPSPSLVRCRYGNGSPVPVTSRAFVFCRWLHGESVDLLGWLKTSAISSRGEFPARKGNHTNYEIEDYQLESMENLIRRIRAYRRITGK